MLTSHVSKVAAACSEEARICTDLTCYVDVLLLQLLLPLQKQTLYVICATCSSMLHHDLCGSLCLAITQPSEAHVPADHWFLFLLACTYTHCWLVWPSAVFSLQAIQLCQ